MKIRLFLFLLPLCVMGVIGQPVAQADTSKNPFTIAKDEIVFENITSLFGGNAVNVLCQDAQGMMWIGTKRGLFSYNGYSACQFINEKGSAGNEIFAIEPIGQRYLAIGTGAGLLWFDLMTEKYKDIPTELNVLGAIRALCYYKGILWIGTRDNGLYRYDADSSTIEKNVIDGGEESLVYTIEPANERLFIGSYEGLSCLNLDSQKRQTIQLSENKRLMVNSLMWDEKNSCVWIGTEGYLFRYDTDSETLKREDSLSENSFKTLCKDTVGNILIGTDAGLLVYNPVTGKSRKMVHDTRNQQSLGNNVIWDINRDKKGNIWLATDRGLSLIRTKTNYGEILISELVGTGEGNNFSCILKDDYGGVWMGGDNGLIHSQHKGQEYEIKWFRNTDEETPLSHNRIRTIYKDRENEIWITTDGGIASYDRQGDKFDYYTIQDKQGRKNANWAYDIYEDRQGRLWIATYLGGLMVVDKTELTQKGNKTPDSEILYLFDEENGLSNNVYKIQADGDGGLWLNTQRGLAHIDMQSMEISHVGEVYMDNMIYNQGRIWYSTEGRISRYDVETKESTTIYNEEGQIYGFLKENNRVWFSSSLGVSFIDTDTGLVTSVVNSDNICQVGYYDSEDNTILWGGEDRIIYFSLNQETLKAQSDSVFITSIQRDGSILKPSVGFRGNSPRYNRNIKIRRRGNISIELSSYSYSQQNGETFFYQIGNDENWHILERGSNRISFFDLPGGSYTLRLCNANPQQGEKVCINNYTIRVPYQWYSAPCSYVVYSILLIMSLFAFIRYLQTRNKRAYEQKEKEKSLELSKLKTDFFINISHELKTPLSLIIAPLSKLIAETPNSKQKDTLIAIQNNSLRLNTLIHKILDFQQLEYESENTLIRSHVELNSMLRKCVESFSTAATERGIILEYTPMEESVWLNVDILKMESVFVNLISNAVRFVDDGRGKVAVSFRKKNSKVIISVSDNGLGFREEELPLVFIRYFQGKEKKGNDGTGIGLYLTKKFVEMHGGEVHAGNNKGKGALLEVGIPLEGENVITSEPESHVVSDEKKEAKLLIVDDNQEMVTFLAEALSDRYACLKAYNGKEALSVVENQKPDLVIVDQMMPVMDGFEFVRKLKRNQMSATIPIIMLTAKDDTETELKSIKAGIDAFIPKPFDMKKLILRITQLLQKQEMSEKTIKMERITKPKFDIKDTRQTPDETLMEAIVKAIEDNMGREEFNVGMLAEIVGVDSKQLYRKIKQFTGTTPVNYVRKLRMKKAAVLLSQNKFNVSEVMYLIGYTNSSYFAKCFSEEFGLSPRTFMERAGTSEGL